MTDTTRGRKILAFDMDGTIADLYSVDNWLNLLRSYDPKPYRDARPMVNMSRLKDLCNKLKRERWEISVITWLAMVTTDQYDKDVSKAKVDWLDAHEFPYDSIYCQSL